MDYQGEQEMAAEVSSGKQAIELEVVDRSEDAGGRPIVGREYLVGERIQRADGSAGVWFQLWKTFDESQELAVTDAQAAQLRDWLISLDLGAAG